MGLDAIEIVLRCEEVFQVTLTDEEVGRVDTVGQLFELLCVKLALAPGSNAPTNLGISRLAGRLDFRPWTREDVWATMIGILCDQLAFDPEDIWYEARLVRDLGIN